MTSAELIKLKNSYLAFKESLEYIIEENTKATGKIVGADVLLDEGYSIGGSSIDGGYVRRTISTINETLSTFKRVLANVNAKISMLTRDIEVAQDKELAEKIAAAGGMTNGNKM